MKKVIILCLLLALSLFTYSCGGGGGAGSSSSPGGENPGEPSVVQLLPSHYVAQTNSFISLHTKVLDGNGKPLPNIRVIYTNLSEPFGVISSVLKALGIKKPLGVLAAKTVKTDSHGLATVKLSSTIPGFVTVQSEVTTGAGIVRDQKTVFFTTATTSAETPPPTLGLHVDDGTKTPPVYDEPDDFKLLKNSSDNTRIVKAVVLDGYGVPFSGVAVTFGSDSSEVTFDRDIVSTGTGSEAGNAYVVMTVNPAIISKFKRYINIFAAADTNNNGTYETGGMITLFLEPVTVSNVAVSANPSEVAPNGTSTITAIVSLSSGTPVPDGETVTFTTLPAGCGYVTPFSQTVGGIASVTFTAPSAIPATNPCTVQASIGGKNGTTSVRVTTELTVQPATQSINSTVGGAATFSIFGGSPPYEVFPDNAAAIFQPVLSASGDLFTITIPAKTTQHIVAYTVRDSRGNTVQARLEVKGAGSLLISPGSQVISGIVDGSASFTVFGGTPPYAIISDSPNPAFQPVPGTLPSSGDSFKITIAPPVGTLPQSILYTAVDAVGSNVTALLSVLGPGTLRIFPSSQTLAPPAVGNTADYSILGGYPFDAAPFFQAYSSRPDLVTVAVNDSTLTATVVGVPTADTTVTLTIYDKVGSSAQTQLILDMPPLVPLAVIPTAQTIPNPTLGPPASEAVYHVIGGSGGYLAYSDNPALVTVAVNGSDVTATVVGIPATDATVNITIYDSAGSSVLAKLTLDLPPVSPLSALVPSIQTISNPTVGPPASTALFQIIGGSGGYNAYTSHPSLVSASVLGSVVTATVLSVPTSDTSVTITVTDSLGSIVTGTLVLDVSPLQPVSVLPTTQIISNPVVGNARTYSIFGGNGVYSAASSNTGLVTVGVAGSVLTATVAGVPAADTTVNITVFDTNGSSGQATLTLDITPTVAVTVLPPTQTITGPAVGNTRNYAIFGGTRTYSAASNNPGLVTTSVLGSTLTATVASVPPADTTITLTVFDTNGSSTSVSLILDIPPAIPLAVLPATQSLLNPAIGNTATYDIIGGAGTYTAYSSNPSFVTVGVAGSVLTATVQAVPAVETTVTISVYDSLGATDNADLVLTIGAADPLTVTPNGVTLTGFTNPDGSNDDNVTFYITGGVSPYSMFSSNDALIASRGPLGVGVDTFTIDPEAVGSNQAVTLTVVDSAGTIKQVTVNLRPATSSMVLNPADIEVFRGDTVFFSTLGGTPNYRRFTTNPGCAPVPPGPGASTTFTINIANNPACTGTDAVITVEDALGNSATATITIY